MDWAAVPYLQLMSRNPTASSCSSRGCGLLKLWTVMIGPFMSGAITFTTPPKILDTWFLSKACHAENARYPPGFRTRAHSWSALLAKCQDWGKLVCPDATGPRTR